MSGLYQEKASECLAFLTRLKKMDDNAKARIKPDNDGWYDPVYVMPEELETVEAILEDGVTREAEYCEPFWWMYNHIQPVTVLVKKWRPIKK